MQIFSQNGPWSVPNKQNPSFYSIFHAFPRPKFPPVWPFPRENTFRRLLGIIHPYRKISRLNTANIDLTIPPVIRIGPPTMFDQLGTHFGQHESNMEPMLGNMLPNIGPMLRTWVQHRTHVGPHGSNMGPMWDPCGPTWVPRVPCGPGTPSQRDWKLFSRTLPLKNDLKK